MENKKGGSFVELVASLDILIQNWTQIRRDMCGGIRRKIKSNLYKHLIIKSGLLMNNGMRIINRY